MYVTEDYCCIWYARAAERLRDHQVDLVCMARVNLKVQSLRVSVPTGSHFIISLFTATATYYLKGSVCVRRWQVSWRSISTG